MNDYRNQQQEYSFDPLLVPYTTYQTPPYFYEQPYNQYNPYYHSPEDFYQSANQPQGLGGVMNYFKGEDGEVDMEKLFVTFGQVMKTAQQISPVMQDFQSMINGFRK
ncbi:hypothetical protein CEY16_09730 [Halalkalibacillus sediminis]|uniref:Uncharacterized protein n=1 Tax=Halalkalibacillus sediminis TaxID=2018042 RepID=A0A2I0QRS6_9BACI|nr:YppG family protein [Halalkalibacillus sediminis]PKR77019.1 hypothetical protein CEY16_09730 [Halalkalibacillus sediminis]